MKIAFISDTHTKHSYLHDWFKQNKVDCVIHSGDAGNHKTPAINNNELRDFLTWYSSLDIKYKIFVPGNHDTSYQAGLVKQKDYPSVKILVNSEFVIKRFLKKNIKIWGSPHTPTFGTGWAYNSQRNKIDKIWKRIPEDTNILVTHGPPQGILDHTIDYGTLMKSVGCKSLLNKVLKVNPTIHAFGHLHDEPGIFNNGVKLLENKVDTIFVNASIVNLKHEPVNKPILLTI